MDEQQIDGILEYLMQNVGASQGGIFLMDAGLPESPVAIVDSIKHQKHLQYLKNRALRLKQIIDEYRTD
jgi:hypothetical protein